MGNIYLVRSIILSLKDIWIFLMNNGCTYLKLVMTSEEPKELNIGISLNLKMKEIVMQGTMLCCRPNTRGIQSSSFMLFHTKRFDATRNN